MSAADGLTLNTTPEHRVLPFRLVQNLALWLFVFSGCYVVVEPAPYEILFVFALLMFLPWGLSVSRWTVPLTLFLVLYNLGTVFGLMPVTNDERAVWFTVTSAYLAVTALYFAFVVAKDPMRIIPVIKNAFILAAVVASITGLIGYFEIAGMGEHWAPLQRAQGTFKDPNVLSTFLILPASFLIHGFITGTQRFRLIAAIALFVILAAVFFAFSRGAWINMFGTAAMMIGLVFLLTPSLALRSRILLFTLGGTICLVALISAALSVPGIYESFLDRAQLIQDYDSGETGRFGRQLNAIPLLLGMPSGMGPMQFYKFLGQDPHNVYLNAFASGGWLAGISYLLLTFSTIAAGWRTVMSATPWQQYSIIVFSALFMTMLQGAQIDTDHWRHYYILLGLTWGLFAATQAWLRTQPPHGLNVVN